jgi:hypothetical protein
VRPLASTLLAAICGPLLLAQSTTKTDEPVTAAERTTWFVESTVGPASLEGGLFSAGFGTLTNRPREYGTHWDGFGRRYGERLTGLAPSNAMEAGLSAFWGEDPRFFRKGGDAPFGNRVKHVVKWTFVAANRDGSVRPDYARFAAISGSNFLSNTWREPSEADNTHAIERIALGFLGRMGGNAWDEFWPDVKQKVFHRHGDPD